MVELLRVLGGVTHTEQLRQVKGDAVYQGKRNFGVTRVCETELHVVAVPLAVGQPHFKDRVVALSRCLSYWPQVPISSHRILFVLLAIFLLCTGSPWSRQ